MNKEDLASIRRELKVNNSKLNLQEICSYYIKQESKDILCSEVLYFAMMDEEKKELFLKNFKKVLSGKIDSKTFELEFKDNKLGQNSTQRNMLDTLKTEDFREATFKIVNKILAETCEIYDKDFMISFVRGEVYKSIKKDNDEIDDEKAYSLGFLLAAFVQLFYLKRHLILILKKENLKPVFL